MILTIFLLIWLISPIVLLPLFIAKCSSVNRLMRQNWQLSEKIKELQKGTAETQKNIDVSTAVNKQPSVLKGESVRYDLPQYDLPMQVTLPPVPQKTETVLEKPKKSVSAINIILILGALLISLSGFIFAVANWGALNTFFKSVVLISFSAVFFAIHSISERKLKLPQTGRVFYILGSIFLPAALVAAGILKVFGEYFSFSGGGRAAVISFIFITICVPFFKGAKDYKNRYFAAVSFYTFSAAIVSLIWQASPSGSVTALLTAVFALGVTLSEPLVKKLLDRLFGEENVFSKEWNRFTVVNAWALSVVSLFAAESGFVSAAAFAVFSACFLTKTLTDKNSAAGAIAFAFFITAAMFMGFDPSDFSEVICVIAATALICGVLSVMGIFPEALKKALNVLGIIAAGITGVFTFFFTLFYFEDGNRTSPELIIALAAVFAELLIFALRYRSAHYKAMSFGAMLLLSANAARMIFADSDIGMYTLAFSYAAVLAYFCAVRFTPLNKRLYHPANDIIFAVYALWCALLPLRATETVSLIIIAAAIILAAFSNHKKISPVICPLLTLSAVFPIAEIFDRNGVSLFSEEPAVGALSAVIILICAAGAVLLFIKKAESYSKACGITAAASAAIFIITAWAYSVSDFVPFLALTLYTAVYLFKSAFPKEKYWQICLFHGMALLTAVFVGLKYADSTYVMCFPSVAAMLIFAVNSAGTAFGSLGKAARQISAHTEHFLWYAMPALSGILLWIFREEGYSVIWVLREKGLVLLLIFGVILAACALLLSVFRRNTLNLIFPVFMGFLAVSFWENVLLDLILAAGFGILGRLLFRRKIKEKFYLDVFGTAAFLFAIAGFNAYTVENWKLWEWVNLILIAMLTANLMRRGHSQKANRIILTVAAVFLFPLWWSEPFFTVPELIAVQFNLLPVVIFCVILRFIWRDSLPAIYNFAFVSAIISLVVLFIAAMYSGNNFDAVFIGIVLLAMLAVSFVIKRKRWFVLAVASMVVSAVLLSISRLDSIAWLVYLAIAGAALIALGVVNELKKQQKRSGEDTKLTRFMSDWIW